MKTEFVATFCSVPTDGRPVELKPPPGYPECAGWLAATPVRTFATDPGLLLIWQRAPGDRGKP
jgi:hypothetical protein